MSSVAERMLTDARRLAPLAAAQAGQCEAARRLLPELVAGLREIGIFRMFVPRSHGGLELDFPESLPIIETLAAADGALGWNAMIGSHLPFFVRSLPRASFDEIYGRGPDLIMGGSVFPVGRAEIEREAYVVSGRWPLASGCQNADIMFGVCVVTKGDQPIPGKDGLPQVRVVCAPASEWQIEETWFAEGLRGTGSHHIVLNGARVRAEMTSDPLVQQSCLDGPLYFLRPVFLLPLHVGAVAVGLLEGAISDLVEFANSSPQKLGATESMREAPQLHHELGRAEADLRAARAALSAECDRLWRAALTRAFAENADAALAHVFQGVAWVAATCARAIDRCFALCGTRALYDSSPLQRRLRDIHAVTQHGVASQKWFANCGKLRLGLPPPPPLPFIPFSGSRSTPSPETHP